MIAKLQDGLTVSNAREELYAVDATRVASTANTVASVPPPLNIERQYTCDQCACGVNVTLEGRIEIAECDQCACGVNLAGGQHNTDKAV
jgi:hypothetical protein